MADIRPLVISSDFFPEEILDADRLLLPGVLMSGDIDMGSNQITSLSDGTANDHAINLSQLNAATSGRDAKENVVAVEVGVNIALTGLPSIDGESPTAGERVLLTAQTSVDENGIWEVQAGAWTRPADFATGASAEGAYVSVSAGTVYEGTAWVAIADVPSDVIDTNDPSFQAIPSATQGGDGIDIVGGIVAVDLAVANPGLQFVTNELAVLIKDATLGVDAAGLFVQGVPLQFTVDGVATSSNVTAANLGTLVGGGNADLLHTHDLVNAALALREDINVNEAVAVGDPIEWSTTADRVQKAQAGTASRVDVFGVTTTSQAVIGSPATVVRRGVAAAVIAGATGGDRFYLGDTGGLVSSPPTGVGRNIIFVGTARNATDLEVHPMWIGRRAA